MEITRDSDFESAKAVVQALIDGLIKCETTFKGTIVTKQDAIKNIAFTGFDDSVGQTFKTRINDLKTGEFKCLEDDFQSGGFKELQTNAKALLNEIQVCINSKAKIAQAEEEMKAATYTERQNINWGLSYQGGVSGPDYKTVTKYRQPAYNNAKAKKEEGEREFDNGVKYANEYIKKFPEIHFTGKSSNNEQGKTDQASEAASAGTQKEAFDKQAALDKFSEELAAMEMGDSMIVYDSDGTECLLVKYDDGALRITVNDGSDKCLGVFGGYDTLCRFTQYNPSSVK